MLVFALSCVFLILPAIITGEGCHDAKVSSTVYTTTEAAVSSHTVFIVDFSVTCKNNPKDLNIYAELNGRTVLATSAGGNKYQVSFSDEHKNFPAGKYVVKFYDDEGYTDLRKAQRSNENTSSVKKLFSVDVHHPGASKGPWFQSEFVAAATSLLVVYLAYSAKSKLQSN